MGPGHLRPMVFCDYMQEYPETKFFYLGAQEKGDTVLHEGMIYRAAGHLGRSDEKPGDESKSDRLEGYPMLE